MNNENCNFKTPDIYVAHLASGMSAYVSDCYEQVKSKKILINLQLRYWTEALEKFQELDEEGFIVEEGVLIINLLANSLSTLAGLNQDGRHYLMDLYDKDNWNLKLEHPEWYEKLGDLNSDYNKLAKHINWDRVDLLRILNYKKVSEYMDLTQKVWVWVLGKQYKGNIPDDQLYHFRDIFPYKI